MRAAVEHRVAANRGVHVHGQLAAELERTATDPRPTITWCGWPSTPPPRRPLADRCRPPPTRDGPATRPWPRLAYDEAAEWYGVALGLLGGHSRDAARLKCRLLVSLGDAHDRAGEKVRARHSFLEAVSRRPAPSGTRP